MGWVDGWIDGWMGGWLDGWMDEHEWNPYARRNPLHYCARSSFGKALICVWGFGSAHACCSRHILIHMMNEMLRDATGLFFFFCEIHILDWELSGHSLIDLYQVVGILGSLGRFQVMAIPLWWMTLCACGSMAMAVPGR